MKGVTRNSDNKRDIRIDQVVPPIVMRAWSHNEIEGKTAKTLLLELIDFMEQHDPEQQEGDKISRHLDDLMHWLYYCTTDDF